jgi:hypothetical protein
MKWHKTACVIAGLISMSSAVLAESLKTSPGQPLCIDQDSLAAFLIANVSHDEKAARSLACEGMPSGSKAEVIERYPSGSDFMRVVKVRVTMPRRLGKTTGYTVELDH